MVWSVIRVQDWEEIRVRARDGVPDAVIARDLGISRNTVARAVRSDRPPVYERKVRVSKFEAFEGRVRALLAQCPLMPASVIGERVDWPFSDRALRENVARLRPEYAPSRFAGRTGSYPRCEVISACKPRSRASLTSSRSGPR